MTECTESNQMLNEVQSSKDKDILATEHGTLVGLLLVDLERENILERVIARAEQRNLPTVLAANDEGVRLGIFKDCRSTYQLVAPLDLELHLRDS